MTNAWVVEIDPPTTITSQIKRKTMRESVNSVSRISGSSTIKPSIIAS